MKLKLLKKIIIGIPLLSVMAMASAGIPDEKIKDIIEKNKLNPNQANELRTIFKKLPYATQGNPNAVHHPVSQKSCEQDVLAKGLLRGGDEDIKFCGHPNMVVLPLSGSKKVCVDRYEFPNIPCDFPITWVQANQAAKICESMGKRLCDAHEWESACSGTDEPEDYQFKGNNQRKEVWAYGPERNPSICAFGEPKSPGCQKAIEENKQVAEKCMPNTWPAGSRYECSGPLGVYDIHGNAAEHMNLARNAKESGKNGGHGVTEMKGSWFVFPNKGTQVVHKDDCRWRAPAWHRTEVMDPRSHANYHLGFRCCSDVNKAKSNTLEAIIEEGNKK